MFSRIITTTRIIKTTIFALMMASVASLSAATLDEERAQLDSLKSKVQQLSAVNQDIELNIADLTTQLAAVVTDSESSKELAEAEAAVLAADQANTVEPSPESKAKLENAEFKLKLAQRKFDKANQEPARLTKERTDLGEALASNQRQIAYLNSRIADQQELINRLGKEQQAATENSLLAQQKQLQQEQQEREQAQQEIVQLKALLAEKEATEAKALAEQEAAALAAAAEAERLERDRIAQAQIDAVETEADAPKPPPAAAEEPAEDGVIFLTDPSQISAEIARVTAQTSKDGAVSKISKILHMKSYRRNRLIKLSSHSLKSLSTSQYQGGLELRKGETQFVVGSKSWQIEIPEADNDKLVTVTLDLSNPEQGRLVIYQTALAQ